MRERVRGRGRGRGREGGREGGREERERSVCVHSRLRVMVMCE
jgi:hypothetical protein